MKFKDVAEFRSGSLFNGAIDLDWYLNDRSTAKKVAESYIFHGKKNHTGDVKNNQFNKGKTLTDSITMTKELLDSINCEKTKMLLSIAGYGAGKSHFAIMMANLLNGDSTTKNKILDNIKFVDQKAATDIENNINDSSQHVLILPINGMRNCNLQDEFLKVAKSSLKADGQPTDFLLKMDKRFQSLAHYLSIHEDKEMISEVLNKSGCSSLDFAKKELDNYNLDLFELILKQLQKVDPFAPVNYSSDVELKDFIPALYSEVCGEDKYYKSILIIFDEFGKYMMFAAEREHVAGNGIMQQLYEGIHANTNSSIVLWGLSQLDLKEYQDSTSTNSANVENNKNRYVTRFDQATRYYLSISFESLISNLISVKKNEFLPDLNSSEFNKEFKNDNYFIRKWYPVADSFPVWGKYEQFCKNIVSACWPLDPYALWLIVSISSVNTILQQRSSLNLLRNIFIDLSEKDIEKNFSIHATDFYDVGLGIEFSNSERTSGSSNQIATDYDTVLDKYGQQLNQNDISVLQAIVIANKIKTKSSDIDEAELIIEKLTGLSKSEIIRSFKTLKNELNIIGQSSNNLYDINSNAPSYNEYARLYKTQFDMYRHNSFENNFSYIKDIIYSNDFSIKKNTLFIHCDTDFGIRHNIRTLEWKFKSDILVSSNPLRDIDEYLNHCDLLNNFSFNEAKGIILYTVIPENNFISSLQEDVKKLLIEKRELKNSRLPIMIILLPEQDDKLVNSALKFKVLKNYPKEQKTKFKVFYDKDLQDCIDTTFSTLDKATKKKIVVADTDGEFKRRKKFANSLFESIYTKIIPFPMEGFSTENGSGVSDVKALIKALMTQASSKSLLTLKATTHNHCLEVLQCWGYFEKRENISRNTCNDAINEVFLKFDNILDKKGSVNLYELYLTLRYFPYGLNSTASSLLTILYYLGRKKRVDFYFNGQSYDTKQFLALKVSDWFDSKKNGLKKNYFSKIELVKLVEDDNRWQLLIDNWNNEETYEKLVEYLELDYKLTAEKHIQVPSAFVSTRDMLRDRSNEAKKKVTDLTMLMDKYSPKFEKELVRESVMMLAFDLNSYNKKLTKIIDDESKWTEKTLEKAFEILNYFKGSYISEKLDVWVNENSLDNLDDKNIEKKHHKYIQLAENLNDLGMTDYSEILQDKAKECKSKLELNDKFNSIIRNFNSNCQSIKLKIMNDKVYNYHQYLEFRENLHNLNVMINNISDEMLTILSKNIDKEKQILRDLSSKLKRINEEKEKQLNMVYDIDIIDDIKTANRLFDKVTSLKSYYIDNKKHSEELDDAENAIKDIKNAYEAIQVNFISYDDLENRYKKLKETIEFNDDELGLEYVNSLDKFYQNFLKKLQTKSNDFYQTFKLQVSKAKEVTEMSKLVSTVPPNYVVQEDELKINSLKEQMKVELSKQKVIYIVDQIKNLEENELKQLKEFIKNIG